MILQAHIQHIVHCYAIQNNQGFAVFDWKKLYNFRVFGLELRVLAGFRGLRDKDPKPAKECCARCLPPLQYLPADAEEACRSCVLLKGFNLSLHNQETILATIDLYYGNLTS